MTAPIVDVCYVLTHGFAARMVMQTDLLGRVAARGLRVAVIAPDAKDPVLAGYCAERGIQLHQFYVQASFSSEHYQFKRKYYLEDLRSNPALYEKHVHAVRYNSSRHPLRRLRPYYYWLVHCAVRQFPELREWFARSEGKYLRSPAATRLLEQLRPRRLIATYPVNLTEAVLLHHANAMPGVQTWMHLLSWDNITCKGRFPAIADKYIAWGPVMREELRQHYGVRDEDVHLCGVPHFDLHVAPETRAAVPQVVRDVGLDPERPFMLMALSAPRFAPREIEIAERLAEQVRSGAFGPMQLLVRPHPQNVSGTMADMSWLPRLEKLGRIAGVAVDMPRMADSRMRWSLQQSDMIRLAALLEGAAVVLNSGSTISIDALMHDTPVIITSFDADAQLDYWQSARRLIDFAHLAKLVELGGVSVVHSYSELYAEIRRYDAEPTYRQHGRRRTVEAQCLSRDGRATERVVEVLTDQAMRACA